MDEAAAIYTVIIGVSALIGFMAPIMKLNNTITKLITTIDFINLENKHQNEKIEEHSKQLTDHEKRITKLEN